MDINRLKQECAKKDNNKLCRTTKCHAAAVDMCAHLTSCKAIQSNCRNLFFSYSNNIDRRTELFDKRTIPAKCGLVG
jgi:hypothetical protein